MTDEEQEKKAEAFISLAGEFNKHTEPKEKPKKEKVKPIYLRSPQSLWDDIHDIMTITGLSMNAICLELLRPGIKRKLKELREGG